MSLQRLDQRIFFFCRGCIVVALFCSEDFIFRITFVRITFESCTFLLFKCRNNLEVILTTESPEWLSSHRHTGWILLVLAAQECSIPSSHLLSVVSAVLSLRGCERREKQINIQFLFLAKFKVWFSFHLIFPKNPSKRFYCLVRAVLQGYWMNFQNPKHSRPSHMQQQLCKEGWEQCPAPPVGNSRKNLQGAL